LICCTMTICTKRSGPSASWQAGGCADANAKAEAEADVT
jgi:hypothetical protein